MFSKTLMILITVVINNIVHFVVDKVEIKVKKLEPQSSGVSSGPLPTRVAVSLEGTPPK